MLHAPDAYRPDEVIRFTGSTLTAKRDKPQLAKHVFVTPGFRRSIPVGE